LLVPAPAMILGVYLLPLWGVFSAVPGLWLGTFTVGLWPMMRA